MVKRKNAKGAPLLTELPRDEQIKYLCALVEAVDSKVGVFGDGLNRGLEQIREEMGEMEKRLQEGIDFYRMAIKSVNADLSYRIEKLEKKREEV